MANATVSGRVLWTVMALVCAAFLVGCSGGEEPAPEPAPAPEAEVEAAAPAADEPEVVEEKVNLEIEKEELAATPEIAVQYGKTLGRIYKTRPMKLNLDVTQQAVRTFHMETGRYPKSLQEMKDVGYGPFGKLPEGVRYRINPDTGEVDLVQLKVKP